MIKPLTVRAIYPPDRFFFFLSEFFQTCFYRINFFLCLCVSTDQLIYITKSCQDYGIVGVSMYLSDVAEDLIYHFNQYSNDEAQSYGFLCDKNGLTIWHPTFPRPNIIAYDITYATDIKYFEKAPQTIRQRWLNDETGIVQISKANSSNRKRSVNMILICCFFFIVLFCFSFNCSGKFRIF